MQEDEELFSRIIILRFYIIININISIDINIHFRHLLTWCKNIWLQVYRHKKMQLKQQEQDMLNCP